jgi:hypothetical protein
MRRFPFLAFMLAAVGSLGAVTPSTAHSADGPAGTWKVRMSFGGRGGSVSILKLQMNGDNLTGVMLDNQGSQNSIENAAYKDGTVSFVVTREWSGQRFTTPYTGTLAGDTIKGTTQFERRGSSRTLNWEATRTTPEEISLDVEVPPVAADIDLSDVNYEVWREHILPEPSELAWEQIPWLTTFKDGILAADAAEKPLLLWTMNGHPLGCT